MKKRILSTLLAASFFLPALPVFSQEQKPSNFEIMYLIDDGLEKNMESIKSKSSGLSDSERLMIFSQKKKEPILPFILNLVLGLGIGSFVSGDVWGGGIEAAGEIGGLVLFSVASGAANAAFSENLRKSLEQRDTLGGSATGIDSGTGAYGVLAIVGIASLVGFRIYGLVQPFMFSSGYNTKLQGALTGNQVSFEPYFNGSEIGLKAVF